MNACRLCGGNAGSLNESGVHYLCAALAAQGLPTPSLGSRCARCNGTGTTARTVAPVIDPSPAALAALFPPCPECNGLGST